MKRWNDIQQQAETACRLKYFKPHFEDLLSFTRSLSKFAKRGTWIQKVVVFPSETAGGYQTIAPRGGKQYYKTGESLLNVLQQNYLSCFPNCTFKLQFNIDSGSTEG